MNVKVPAVVVSSMLCLAIGVGLGVLAMTAFGYQWQPTSDASSTGMPVATKGSAKAPAGGDKGKKGRGGFGPKTQLGQLVTRLDVLTSKPLYLDLSAETRLRVHEQLQGLAPDQDLTDDVARQKLDGLLEILKDHKETLEAAGFRYPDAAAPRFPAATGGNPFKDERTAKHLQDLQQRMQKAQTKI